MIAIETAIKNGRGSLATKLLVSSQFVEKIPEAYTPQQASGLSLVGLTALALASHAQKGERVLVAGGSTAVGLLLIKMLKAKGCSLIVATGSGGKLDVIKSRGTDDVVDCECLFSLRLACLFSLIYSTSEIHAGSSTLLPFPSFLSSQIVLLISLKI